MVLRGIQIRVVVVITFTCVCATGVKISNGHSSEGCPISPEDNELVEAVFRFQLEHHNQKRRWKVFYLAIGLDPSDEECVEHWVTALRDNPLPVRRFIRKEYDAERIQKESGFVLGVAEVKRKSETEAEVEGYTFIIPGEAQGYRYYLVRENEKWVVKTSKGTWIASVVGSEQERKRLIQSAFRVVEVQSVASLLF